MYRLGTPYCIIFLKPKLELRPKRMHNGLRHLLMKKEFTVHFGSLLVFFLLISLARGWYSGFVYLYFWLGGIVGVLLPDLDHILYSLFLRPTEFTSQRTAYLLKNKRWANALGLLVLTKHERTYTVFHSYLFELVAIILMILVITSSGSLFGRGMVLGIMLHLLLDQFMDLQELNSLGRWQQKISLKLEKDQEVLLWLIVSLVVLVFAFIF